MRQQFAERKSSKPIHILFKAQKKFIINFTLDYKTSEIIYLNTFKWFQIIIKNHVLKTTQFFRKYFIYLFFLFYLYIYPPGSQESDGGAHPRPASGDSKILLSACNLTR